MMLVQRHEGLKALQGDRLHVLVDKLRLVAEVGALHQTEAEVFVEGGVIEPGSDQGYPEERGGTPTRVEGFWIDRTEVTNRHFAAFVTDLAIEQQGLVVELKGG